MKLPRRNFLHLAAGAAALPVASRVAWAQTYPARPVRIIVTTTPGGAPDILARLMGPWLSERLGQQFVVENRPGGGSNIGTEAVVRAPPDGHTLLLVTTNNAINMTLYDKLNFNFIRDIAPVAGVVRVPNVMEVNPSFPAKTAPEFIAYAKANPNKLNFGSGGNGTASHMQFELFKLMSGVSMVHVPYRGSAPALTDLLSGQILEKLNNAINAGLADPKIKARLAEMGGMLLAGSPADFGKLIAEETDKWGQVIRTANIKAE